MPTSTTLPEEFYFNHVDAMKVKSGPYFAKLLPKFNQYNVSWFNEDDNSKKSTDYSVETVEKALNSGIWKFTTKRVFIYQVKMKEGDGWIDITEDAYVALKEFSQQAVRRLQVV